MSRLLVCRCAARPVLAWSPAATLRGSQTEAATDSPLPPSAAFWCPPPPSYSSSGNRGNRRRIRRVDGRPQLLRDELVRRCARVYAVARERRPERIGTAGLSEERERPHRRRHQAQ